MRTHRAAIKRRHSRSLVPLIAALGIGAIGTIFLVMSHAATPTAAVETEAGSMLVATSVTDTTASGGSAVKFGSDTLTTGTPGFGKGIIDNCPAITGHKTCTAADYTQTAKVWRDAGMTHLRYWLGCNVDANTIWNSTLQYYAAQGITPVLVIACGGSYQATVDNNFAAWFTGFVQTMATHNVHYYEIGNEPNINCGKANPTQCGGNWQICTGTVTQATRATDVATPVADYVHYLQQAYTIAHANDAKAYVISAGISHANTTDWCIITSGAWVKQMALDGADKYMDGFGYHPYSLGNQSPENSLNDTLNSVKNENINALKVKYGINDGVPDRPVWITEVGTWVSRYTPGSQNGGVNGTEANRADMIKPLYDGLKAAGIVTPVFWYIDSEGATAGYGLETSGTGQGCSYQATTMGVYTGHNLLPIMCAIKAYQ